MTQSCDRSGMPVETEVSDFLPFVYFLSGGISYAVAKLKPDWGNSFANGSTLKNLPINGL